MECKFVVGQKVVCVDTKWLNGAASHNPQLDGVYTVREILICDDGLPGLLFQEIVNAARQFSGRFGEVAFDPSHFRPAIDFQSLCDVKREERV